MKARRLAFLPPWRTLASALAVYCLSACSLPHLPSQCPTRLNAKTLQGQWQVQLADSPEAWTLTLSAHPEHIGSWRGELVRGTQRHQVVADLDDGDFTMEESMDGLRIAATWLGKASNTECAPHIQGHRMVPTQNNQAFTLKPLPPTPK